MNSETKPSANFFSRLRHYRSLAKGHDLKWLNSEEIRELEPELGAASALHSPSTGILDTHALMLALQADIESAGGNVVSCSGLAAAQSGAAGTELTIESVDETTKLTAMNVVNCAGLHASEVAEMLHGDEMEIPPTRNRVRRNTGGRGTSAALCSASYNAKFFI